MALSPVVLGVIVGWLCSSLVMNKLELPEVVPLAIRVSLLGILAYAAIRHLLSEGRVSGVGALRGGDAGGVRVFVMLALLLVIILRLGRHAFGANIETAVQSVLATLVPFILALALIGTIFPAVVDRGDTSLRTALARRSFWPTVWRMVNAIGICFVILTVITMFTVYGGAGFWLAGIGFGAVLCYGTILLSVIVTWAYQGVWQQEKKP